jgi:outer membrane protein assembly factor BamB
MRSWPVRLALLVVLVLVAAGRDWTMFGYGPAHTHYNPTEKTIGVGNVAELTAAWTGATGGFVQSSAAVADGVVYVGSFDGKLYAFDAAGSTGCSGTPKTCAPLWTTVTLGAGVYTSPAVVNGMLYVVANSKLYAFDAAGSTDCSGTPKTCAPLWTANADGAVSSSPAVANGVVYFESATELFAVDAAGSTGCSGTPKTCAPLWTANVPRATVSSPAVANGVVYIASRESMPEASDAKLYAFDAAGSTGCSGTPKTCAPLWTAAISTSDSSPAVADGVVYVGSYDPNASLYAFDAAGSTGCSGTPKTCSPLWTATTEAGVESSPAVANGVVYVGSTDTRLYAFDAAGSTGCSGTPKACSPLWIGHTGGIVGSSPAVADGVVYIGSIDSRVYAFDAAGSTDCSGTFKVCTPLWTATTGGAVNSSPVVANGVLYVGSDDHQLYAYEPHVNDERSSWPY